MCLAMLSLMNFVFLFQVLSLLTVTWRFLPSLNQLSDLLLPSRLLLLLLRRVLHRLDHYSVLLVQTQMLHWFLLLLHHFCRILFHHHRRSLLLFHLLRSLLLLQLRLRFPLLLLALGLELRVGFINQIPVMLWLMISLLAFSLLCTLLLNLRDSTLL